MSELTTKRVIAIVLLFALLVLDLSTSTPLKSWNYAMDYMSNFLGDEKSVLLAYQFIANQKADPINIKLYGN